MTCQWCVHYRRRGGRSLCLTADGKAATPTLRSVGCDRFRARKSCTTCEHRCSMDEKTEMFSSPEGCSKWELRTLSSWGGRRVRTKPRSTTYAKEA